MLFGDIEHVRLHIEKAIDPATSAGNVDKWTSNLDLVATAKLFRINVVVCELITNNNYRWQVYSPELEHSVNLFI